MNSELLDEERRIRKEIRVEALNRFFAEQVAAARLQGYQDAIDALRETVAEQGSWLWFELGERALLQVANWLEATAEAHTKPAAALTEGGGQ